jgi:hypothetical protein
MTTLTVNVGMPVPTVTLVASESGTPVMATWGVDRGEIGIVSSAGVFTPSGTTAGTATVTASYGGHSGSATVLVKIVQAQNGGTAAEMGADAGSGGYGGVGGAGIGPAVGSSATLGTLSGTPAGNGMSQGLAWLYPYDGTVWPRGLLAPLLQWSWSGSAPIDAIAIHLQTASGSFTYDGTFGPPAGLAGGPFVDHPIPQDAWSAATNSAGGTETLSVRLVVASGGSAYGPLTQTWTVAPARLAGTLYYNAYMTDLVKNADFPTTHGGGAAIMGIHVGDTSPFVVAGKNDPPGSAPGTGCRACHTVASNGSVLIAQDAISPSGVDDYSTTGSFNLLAGNAETVLGGYPNIFGWAALSPDGKLAVTNTATLSQAPGDTSSHVYSFVPPTAGASPMTGTGLDTVMAATPAFSPDGKHLAFTLQSSSSSFPGGLTGGNGTTDTQVVVVDFNGTAFSNARVVYTLPAAQIGTGCVGFPSFTPDSQAVLVQLQHAACGTTTYNAYLGTMGVQSDVWWAPVSGGTPTLLSALNGKSASGSVYLPTSSTHADDSVLNYEPTVNPVVSGGYAWVVFTSRRLYGNVATAGPMESDPQQGFDPTTAITPKKLWVAALALNAPAGKDPSFPAFYLPAQELRAGNSRGFWVLEPCRPDGTSCMSGDQCCGGYCEPGDAGSLVCQMTPPGSMCSGTEEKCTTSADCCDPTQSCIDGFCAMRPPQ